MTDFGGSAINLPRLAAQRQRRVQKTLASENFTMRAKDVVIVRDMFMVSHEPLPPPNGKRFESIHNLPPPPCAVPRSRSACNLQQQQQQQQQRQLFNKPGTNGVTQPWSSSSDYDSATMSSLSRDDVRRTGGRGLLY